MTGFAPQTAAAGFTYLQSSQHGIRGYAEHIGDTMNRLTASLSNRAVALRILALLIPLVLTACGQGGGGAPGY